MNSRTMILALAAVAVVTGCGQEGKARQAGDQARGVVELTVYSDDFAMVREERSVSLEKGRTKLRLPEVSRQLDPSSVLFGWPKGQEAQVVSNTYDLGAEGSNAVLQRYVGQEVEMVWTGSDGREGKRAKGTLEVGGDGGVVFRSEGKLWVNPNGTIVAPTRSDVVTIPQLSVDVESEAARATTLDVAYLTRGLAWSADYVNTLDPDKDEMRLECWATVTNRTGTTFPEAKITLVAGSPNRAAAVAKAESSLDYDSSGFNVYRNDATLPGSGRAGAGRWYAYNGVVGAAVAGELYAYPVKAAATIAPEQMNRVRMLYSPNVAVQRDYSVRLGDEYGYYNSYGGNQGSPRRQSATLAIRFVNDEKSGLGAPLPKGAVRVYEPDANGAPRYIGAASVGDTPKQGRVNLTLTNVFDVTSESRLVRTVRVDKKHIRWEYEAVLRNAKKSPITLRVVHSLGGKIVSESMKSTKLDARTMQWKVPIPAGGETKLTYSVLFG